MSQKDILSHHTFRKSLTILRSASYYIVKSKKLLVGTSILSSLILIAIFEPLINGVRLGGLQSSAIGYFPRLQMPSLNHPLGTDHFGRD
ncbi:MAG: hypothetical protein QW734_05965, partial [Candidatus Bathyarchaeia archaeon]